MADARFVFLRLLAALIQRQHGGLLRLEADALSMSIAFRKPDTG